LGVRKVRVKPLSREPDFIEPSFEHNCRNSLVVVAINLSHVLVRDDPADGRSAAQTAGGGACTSYETIVETPSGKLLTKAGQQIVVARLRPGEREQQQDL
jgi:hypothetical protein